MNLSLRIFFEALNWHLALVPFLLLQEMLLINHAHLLYFVGLGFCDKAWLAVGGRGQEPKDRTDPWPIHPTFDG